MSECVITIERENEAGTLDFRRVGYIVHLFFKIGILEIKHGDSLKSPKKSSMVY